MQERNKREELKRRVRSLLMWCEDSEGITAADRIYQEQCAEWWPLPKYQQLRQVAIAELEARKGHQEALKRQKIAEQERRVRLEIEGQKKRRLGALHEEFLREANKEMRRNFLDVDGWYVGRAEFRELGDSALDDAKIDFVTEWCSQNVRDTRRKPFRPDREQAAAIAKVHGNVLVEARAGSGKTATMVARSVFLVKACRVDPRAILMMAFNREAAEEMRVRLEANLGGDRVPHVMTFHALAHRVVHPEEKLLYDKSDVQPALSHHVQNVISELLRSQDGHDRIRDLMLSYFREDWERIERGGYDLEAAEGLNRRHNLVQESIKGDYTKSYGEKLIANILFTNGICGDKWGDEPYYGYEHDVRWNGKNYRPDFCIYNQNNIRRVIIEYFGLVGDSAYDAQVEEKRAFWAKRTADRNSTETTFLEYFPEDITKPNFEERLCDDLRNANVPLNRLSDEELWSRVRDRAIDRFTKAVTTLIGRARQRRWNGSRLREEWELHDSNHDILSMWLEVAATILDSYEASLRPNGVEDFTGLMWKAVDKIRAGSTHFGRANEEGNDLRGLHYIVVDEFQDFSLMFHDLTKAVMELAINAELMAVGDDWQAINEFAGSTLEYFRGFKEKYPPASRLALLKNRRSTPAIVGIGNRVMHGMGDAAIAGNDVSGAIRWFDADDFAPSPIEEEAFGKYEHETAMLLRLIRDHLAKGRMVAVLSRRRSIHGVVEFKGRQFPYSSVEEFGNAVRSILGVEDGRVQFSSVHGFKGNETDVIILTDVTSRNYPLIHPTWMLFRVFGDTEAALVEAERRLFYVGVSRPRTHLDVITVSGSFMSEFWRDALAESGVVMTAWKDVPSSDGILAGNLLEIRVRNGINRDDGKAALMGAGYRYRPAPDYVWVKVVTEKDYNENELRTLINCNPGMRCEVYNGGTIHAQFPGAADRVASGAVHGEIPPTFDDDLPS